MRRSHVTINFPEIYYVYLIGIIGSGGSEDCLFLNIYTPQIVGSRAVMVSLVTNFFDGYEHWLQDSESTSNNFFNDQGKVCLLDNV